VSLKVFLRYLQLEGHGLALAGTEALTLDAALAQARQVHPALRARRAERRAASGLSKDWTRLRGTARLSGALWFATVLAGVMLSKA